MTTNSPGRTHPSFRLHTAILPRLAPAIALLMLSLLTGTGPVAAQVSLVSGNAAGTDTAAGNSGLGDGTIVKLVSADGRFLAFESEAADLGPTDTNGKRDVYLRDLVLGSTTLISVNLDGTDAASNTDDPENLESQPIAISPDGRFVLFTSTGSDLVPLARLNDPHDPSLYLRDTKFGTTELVNVNLDGTGTGNFGLGSRGEMTPDGRFISFSSGSTNLVDASIDVNGDDDVFVRDMKTGTTTLVSVNETGESAFNSNAEAGNISADGRFVLFGFNSDGLLTADNNGVDDVFLRDMDLGVTTMVSLNQAGTASGNGASSIGAISEDGTLVAFQSKATDLVATTDTNGAFDVFVRNLETGSTMVLSLSNSVAGSTADAQSLLWRMPFGGTRFVVFQGPATDITAEADSNIAYDVFVHDLAFGTNTLISIDGTGTMTGDAMSTKPLISADGRFVSFQSRASDLQSAVTDDNERTDVYVRDLQLGITTLLSNLDGTVGNDDSEDPASSADGRTVAFESEATNLTSVDTNGGGWGDDSDVFVIGLEPVVIRHDLAVAGGGFRTAKRIRLGKCAPNCSRAVRIKIKNLGDHDEASVAFDVSVVAGDADSNSFCSGDAGPIAAGSTTTVTGCQIGYSTAGAVQLLLTVEHPDSPSLDLDPSNNTASLSVKVIP
jgi:Tol biopolymer transport system component